MSTALVQGGVVQAKVSHFGRAIMRTALVIIVLCSLGLAACANSGGRSEVGERYATLDTSKGRPSQYIFPVVITEVDGKRVDSLRPMDNSLAALRAEVARGHSHRLTPGEHTIKAIAVVERPASHFLRGRPPIVPPLTHNFEAGMVYYLGLDARSHDPDDWRLVIVSVDETEQGRLEIEDPSLHTQ